MRPATAERILTWLLRIMGAVTLLALIAVVMPTAWIEAAADWSQVGPFPDTPLTQYLARSVSSIYALLGALVLYLSFDVRRYLDLVAYIGWLTIAFGALLTGVDFAVGMPPSWSWGEGPPTVVTGAVFLFLAARAGREGGGQGS